MKNIKILKKLFILVMSIGLVLTFSNLVYAEDEDPFFAITATEESSNQDSNTASNEQQATNTNTDTSLFTDIDNTNSNNTNTANTNSIGNSSITTNDTLNNTNNNVVNRSVTNTDTLAKTGLSDSKGMVTLIVVLCGISAIYSYKKVNDYKKL